MTETVYNYTDLLDMLTAHPEFTYGEDNPCDLQIVSYGKQLWQQWLEEEKFLPFDETGIPETLEDCGLVRSENTVRRQIATLALAGYDAKSTAKELGKTEKNVANVYSQLGFPQKNESSYPFTKEQLIDDLKEIRSFTVIGAKYGRSYTFIRNAVKFYGIDLSAYSKRTVFKVSTAELSRVYNEMLSIQKTADYFGVSYDTVRKSLNNCGIRKQTTSRKRPVASKTMLTRKWKQIGTLRGMADYYSVSTTYMSSLLESYGIRKKGGRGSGTKSTAKA